MLNVIINIIYCAFIVWLISLLFAILESMRPQKKQVPKPGLINTVQYGFDIKAAFKSLNLMLT